ncbi:MULTISPECIES: GNAT family protein [unclassified Streptomyces]|uniref:GNAT family N-acetyltransferase n=1 Tax=unclassified Streptomyces TaxID=2593676 RepID=UPI002E7707F8|nr:GNAT family protein [Streptomyces sp. JV176]MEE1802322.1 GNAT family protein [Streptomyces sp. JV176]
MAHDSSILISPATPGDAERVAEALLRNRDHMRPWGPIRPADFFTAQAQAHRLADPSERLWHLKDGERVVGQATLSHIALGPFRSANLGYWVDAEYTGRGLATRLVEQVCRAAREDLGLHRVEAGTVLANAASQRVLRKCGFELIGTAPDYLHVDGAWRDHHLFQRILHNGPPNTAP